MTQQKTYLNTAAFGLISPETTNAGLSLYRELETNASAAAEYWRDVQQAIDKQYIADFVGAPAKNMAIVPNFSYGINALVHSLRGDEKILLYKQDYPSLYTPFVINNFDITWIDDTGGFIIDIHEIEQLILQKGIDIVAISHVQWQTGFKTDIEALGHICRSNNTLLIIDGTQSLGAVNLSLQHLPVDVFIASNYKWMNAGFGTGILYATDAFLEKYPPKTGGNQSRNLVFTDNSYQHYSFTPLANNYEPGHYNMFGITVLRQAIEEKNSIGLQTIEKHNALLTQKFLETLKSIHIQPLGGYSMRNRTSIAVLEDNNGLGDFLVQNNIIVTNRNNRIRIAFHFYNTEKDADTIADALKSWKLK